MSEIKAKLQADIKTAMKARNQEVLTNLRSLSAAIKQVEIDTRTELDDAAITGIIQKEIKMRRDALKFAEQQQREDLITQNQGEIALLQGYLGEQLSEEELKSIIQKMVSGGADSIGKVMGGLNKEYKGKFEGSVASALAKDLLS